MPSADYGQYNAGGYAGGTAYPAQPGAIGFAAPQPGVAMPAPVGAPQVSSPI